jgi:hypothetical protein
MLTGLGVDRFLARSERATDRYLFTDARILDRSPGPNTPSLSENAIVTC